jgi:hypothetical protein
MIQTVKCKECGGEYIGLDNISVDVIFTEHIYCDKCRNSHQSNQSFFFCSQTCFNNYIKKVVEGKAKMHWVIWDRLTGQTINPIDD